MLLFCWLIVLVWQFTRRDKEPWQRSNFYYSSHCLQPIEIIVLNQKHSFNENDLRMYPEETHADLLGVFSLNLSTMADTRYTYTSTFPLYANSVLSVWRMRCRYNMNRLTIHLFIETERAYRRTHVSIKEKLMLASRLKNAKACVLTMRPQVRQTTYFCEKSLFEFVCLNMKCWKTVSDSSFQSN